MIFLRKHLITEIPKHRQHLSIFRREFSAEAKETNKKPKFESVVGLEVHAQITTNTKLFSGASTDSFHAPANSCVALFDAAISGTLPSVMNKEPFFNEPGYFDQKNDPKYKKRSDEYPENVEYEKFCVAVLCMVSNEFGETCSLPAALKEQIGYMFIYHYDEYMETIRAKIAAGSKFGCADLAQKFEKNKLAMDDG